MPELPELAALAEGLTAECAGAVITGADALQPQVLKTADPPLRALVDTVVVAVRRRGKLILLDAGELTLVMHLMQGGRLGLVNPTKRRPGRAVALTIELDGLGAIRLRESATEHRAHAHVVRTSELETLPLVAGLGPEPIGLAPSVWQERLASPNARLHTALRDGHRIAGIGRAYAADIMWVARLSPFASTAKLTADEYERLAGATDTVLNQALARARERITINLPDREERVTIVHKHFGDPCLRCGRKLERVSFDGYELVYCPDCQTAGKVLADRRLSRLLK